MSWEWILGLLPLLLVLVACPLAMFMMMRGMSHGGSGGKTADSGEPGLKAVPVRTPDEEIRDLRERLARLEAERQRSGSWS